MPFVPQIDSIEISPNQNQAILTYTSDPGAFYEVETSTTLEPDEWSSIGSTVAEVGTNVVEVTFNGNTPRQFLRLRRSQ